MILHRTIGAYQNILTCETVIIVITSYLQDLNPKPTLVLAIIFPIFYEFHNKHI